MLTRVIVTLSIVMVLFACALWPQIDFYMMTHHFFPVKKIDSLNSVTPVTGWNAAGLTLEGGRMLPLPELRSLPAESTALAQVIQRGVEIGTNGRVYGLVKIHHWCGNDPVREHIAKIDISDMLLFLRECEPTSPIADTKVGEYMTKNPGGRFSASGWNISEYLQFTSWTALKAMALEDTAP